jgi:Trypsin-co-occurring domain 1
VLRILVSVIGVRSTSTPPMAKLLEISTSEGDVLIATRTAEDAVRPVGVRDDVVEKVEASLEDALRIVRRIATSFHDALAETQVEKAEVELGLQFTGKGRLYVVESELQAAMTVRLTLKPNG